MSRYRKMFEERGLRVHVWPYAPLKLFTMKIFTEGSLQGDALKQYKEVFPHYDIAIGNYFTKPLIQLLNPDLRE